MIGGFSPSQFLWKRRSFYVFIPARLQQSKDYFWSHKNHPLYDMQISHQMDTFSSLYVPFLTHVETMLDPSCRPWLPPGVPRVALWSCHAWNPRPDLILLFLKTSLVQSVGNEGRTDCGITILIAVSYTWSLCNLIPDESHQTKWRRKPFWYVGHVGGDESFWTGGVCWPIRWLDPQCSWWVEKEEVCTTTRASDFECFGKALH